MELEQSWSRKKKELEQSTAAGLSVLLRPRVGGSVAAHSGWTAAAGSGQTVLSPRRTSSSPSSLLSAAVREMLAAQRLKPVAKKPRGPLLTPSSGADAESKKSSATKDEVAPGVLPSARTRQTVAKRVARRMLRRRGSASPPAPEDGGTKVVMSCCCERLPPGLRCALHQRDDAPGRPWTRDGSGGTRGWAFSEYARWRRSVWLPSRFYLERACNVVGPEERAPPRPALLIERTARSGGVSVRRFLLVVDGDPEQSGSGM